MSALPLETDVPLYLVNVGLGPEPDIQSRWLWRNEPSRLERHEARCRQDYPQSAAVFEVAIDRTCRAARSARTRPSTEVTITRRTVALSIGWSISRWPTESFAA